MRQIILMMSMSLDGYVEGPDRQIDWHRVDDEVHRHANDEVRAMGGLLEGRVTYELMESVWPTADADPANAGPTADFARIWRDTPKYVYSRTLQRVGDNATIVRDVVPAEVAALKAAPGGDLGLGGAGLATAFLAHDLVDAYRIYVHPVRIGRGTPLFPQLGGGPVPLRLEGTHTFGNGVVQLRYARP
ncbi:dihydrofolate reductase family protein [Streptomyces sp. NBC_00536]|uniref:dihydrofolate reductase family protein n=1 Tax=Streptomyces sp. NBC_00536 TaxID=2975769 RepID=UPI002E814881|nr:dihydrofolate reductase family protein [Streptomyces sp. NBC_00536]WUC77032.1 dihydrofolate reductase family protein [Streptomyces sp. NBC_00536]